MQGLLDLLEVQHVRPLYPNCDLLCISVLCLIGTNVKSFVSRQHLNPNSSVMPLRLGWTTTEDKQKALNCYYFITVLSHPAAGPQQGTS